MGHETPAITPWRWLDRDRLRALNFGSRRADFKRLAIPAGDNLDGPVPVRRKHDSRRQLSASLRDLAGAH